ncbi:hemerythrin domain-containing protein [Leifsonia sp. YIM 134122]|uniref:Hemerythrin domain-containing protein n=1 Tax=Leifsonia stereocauli TaxID=3134136 RepID=A0ABU9W7B7_9MICO
MSTERLIAWGHEMRAVHERLRQALAAARETVESGGDTASVARDIRLFCWGFCVALDGHHASEDTALFPEVVRQHPELQPIIAKLMQDHRMIAHLIRDLERALQSGAEPALLLGHLDGIGAIMTSHFGYEERQLLGVLDTIEVSSTDATPRSFFGPLAE